LPVIMKKLTNYFTIIFIALLISCTNEKSDSKKGFETDYKDSEEIKLGILSEISKIEFLREDDKYGEWGGDVDVIDIYKYKDEIFANYKRYVGKTTPPPPPDDTKMNKKWYEYKSLENKIDSIKLSENEKKLVETIFSDLLKNKMKNDNIPIDGYYNSVIASDSSLVIIDYNSFEWSSFMDLKTELTKK